MDIKVGDWIKSYSQGIWRVERIINDHFETRYSQKDIKIKSDRVLIFSKRLINDRWKRSFSVEVCELAKIQKLSDEEQELLNNFINENKKVLKEFEKYKRDIDLVLNLCFSIDDNIDFDLVVNKLFENKIQNGLTSDEIIDTIEKSILYDHFSKNPRTRTIQFIAKNHEIKDLEFIYRGFRILNF